MEILFLVLFRPPDTETQRKDEDGENDDVGDDARWCRDTDGGTEGGDDGDDGEGGVVGDDADRVTMVQRHGESRTRSTGSVCYLPAHTSCLLVEPPLLF